MGITTVSKEIQFDAGHRIPDHHSKCFSPHGHRYRVRATCTGSVVDEEGGVPDNGMVVDFADLKKWLTVGIHDLLDHSMIIYMGDKELLSAISPGLLYAKPNQRHLSDQTGWVFVSFPYVPTAENIARWCWEQLSPRISEHWRENMRLSLVEVWETPTSLATYSDAAETP